MKKALFIDRDGTLVIEPPVDYQLDSFHKLEFYPKVFRNLGFIRSKLDFEFVMVTNQDGLGTSSFPEDTFWPVHNLVLKTLEGEGIIFDDILIDRSFPEDHVSTRKPGTGMMGKYLIGDYDLANSFVIGDRATDVELAKNMGCKAILLQENMDILKEKKVTATFYVTLDYVKSSPELVQRMINEGHEVGNHSCTHPSLPDISDDMVFEEIQGLETYISDNFGGYKTVTMRPPRGEFSVRTLRIAKNMGYDTVLWSFAYNDWNTDAQPDRDTAYRRITSATHNGAVYLLHAVSETNTAILPDVIDYWLDNGYTVKSISG